MKIRGKTWKFGDDVDTDAIIPARYLNTTSAKELAGHCMEDADPEFASRVKPGDIIAAGKNFGCGSSREHAPLALLGGGVNVVLAQSFARIFFRNAINVGVLPVVCPGTDRIEDGAKITLDIKKGYVDVDGQRLPIEPVPPFMQGIIDAGGLVEYAKNLREVPVCTKSRR